MRAGLCCLLLLGLALALAQAQAPPNYAAGNVVLSLNSLSAYPAALCNDGTPGGYYFSAGSDASLWVVYLEGGYWCIGYDSCQGRAQKEPDQVSSSSWGSETVAGGIFSRDSTTNPWAAANFAYVRYCSSDAWMGSVSTFGMQFRGQDIVAAVLADLQARRGLAPGARLLFGGCSAGARGAMVHLDNVAAALPGVEVRGMLDSAYWINLAPSGSDASDALGGSLIQQAEDVYGFANTTGVISAQCAQLYAATPWYCLFGQYRVPLLETSYFLSQSQFDDMQVDYDCGSTTATDMAGEVHTTMSGAQVPCANAFQLSMREELETLPAPGQTGVGIFSTTCSIHCVTNGPDWWTLQVGGASMASLMTTWYFAFDTPYTLSECIGVACTNACLSEEQPFPAGDFDATTPPAPVEETEAASGGLASDDSTF